MRKTIDVIDGITIEITIDGKTIEIPVESVEITIEEKEWEDEEDE